MKKCYLGLLLICLLLCGCAADNTAPESTPLPSEAQSTAFPLLPAGLYDAQSKLEAATGGAVQVYPLPLSNAFGLCPLGSDLLVFSGTEEGTTITKLSGEELFVQTSIQLSFPLSPEDASFQVHSSGISYYNPTNRQTVVLDTSLKEISHIAVPEELVGIPILSADLDTLYYCTTADIRAWNLETGIRRVVKEIAHPSQSITGLHLNDMVLQCSVTDSDGTSRTLLLSTENGRLLYEGKDDLVLNTDGSNYFAMFPTGITHALLFGEGDGKPQALIPADITASCTFLPRQRGAVTASQLSEDEIQLDYYELDSGRRRSSLLLSTQYDPLSITETADGCVSLLIYDTDYGCETLYRWDSSAASCLVGDSTDYVDAYYTAADPDYHGIVWCQSYAEKIGSKYGIEVLVWEDAMRVQPWDYDFEIEYLVPVIRRELELLDQRLSNFPEGFLEATASHFSSLKICLVRQLTGSAESGSLDLATGIQFIDGTDAYIVLAAGESAEKALYHELYHVMETHILGNSIAFDQWSKLNPVGFEYDYDYIANAQRDGSAYLAADTRSFVDTYSMSFPKEDRARIMEYAMAEGSEDLFTASPLQYKLKILCEGIREAYDLEKSPETYLWEQYLVQPLAYKG